MFFQSKAFTVLIVAGSPQVSSPKFLAEKAKEAQYIIACDSGAISCMKAQIPIDVLIGDNDSLDAQALEYARSCNAKEELYPCDKDETDLKLAISYVWKNIAPKHKHIDLVVSCASGGRPDHALGVIGNLIEAQALHPRIEEEHFTCYILSHEWDDHIVFGADKCQKTLSIIALENPTKLSIRSCKWSKESWTLRAFSDQGISNIIEKPGASILVHQGSVLCYLID